MAQDAQSRAGDGPDDALGRIELVVASAEEDELVGGHPPQQLGGIADLVGSAGAPCLQLGGDLVGSLGHRAPVGHRVADGVERGGDVSIELLHPVRVEHPVDLEVDEGLGEIGARPASGGADEPVVVASHPQDGVNEQVDLEAGTLDGHQHRGDDERRVVGDQIDHGVGRAPAVVLDRGGIDPQERLARAAVASELQV